MCGNPCAVQVHTQSTSTVYSVLVIRGRGAVDHALRGKREKEKYGSTGEIQTVIGIGAGTMGQPSKRRSILILSSSGEYVHSGYLDVHIPCPCRPWGPLLILILALILILILSLLSPRLSPTTLPFILPYLYSQLSTQHTTINTLNELSINQENALQIR